MTQCEVLISSGAWAIWACASYTWPVAGWHTHSYLTLRDTQMSHKGCGWFLQESYGRADRRQKSLDRMTDLAVFAKWSSAANGLGMVPGAQWTSVSLKGTLLRGETVECGAENYTTRFFFVRACKAPRRHNVMLHRGIQLGQSGNEMHSAPVSAWPLAKCLWGSTSVTTHTVTLGRTDSFTPKQKNWNFSLLQASKIGPKQIQIGQWLWLWLIGGLSNHIQSVFFSSLAFWFSTFSMDVWPDW